MKRIVLLFVIGLVAASLGSPAAHAQRSGTMQVTARVLDTRDSWAGLNSARRAASDLSQSRAQAPATVETALASVSVQMTGQIIPFDRPRAASVTINYLRN